jgi:hypothetical protein
MDYLFSSFKRANTDFAWNQDNVFEWSDLSIRGLLFQWLSTIKNISEQAGLVQSRHNHHLTETKLILAMI